MRPLRRKRAASTSAHDTCSSEEPEQQSKRCRAEEQQSKRVRNNESVSTASQTTAAEDLIERENKQLQKKCDSLQKTVELMRKNFIEVQKIIDRSADKQKSVAATMGSLMEDIERRKEKEAEYKSELAKLRSTVEQLKAKQTHMTITFQERVKIADKRAVSVASAKQRAENDYLALKRSLSTTKESLAYATTALNKEKQSKSSAEITLCTEKKLKEQAEKTLAECQAEKAKLKEQAEKELAECRSEKAKLTVSLGKINQEKTDLVDWIKKARVNYTGLVSEYKKLKQESDSALAEQKSRVQTLEKDRTSITKHLKIVMDQLANHV